MTISNVERSNKNTNDQERSHFGGSMNEKKTFTEMIHLLAQACFMLKINSIK